MPHWHMRPPQTHYFFTTTPHHMRIQDSTAVDVWSAGCVMAEIIREICLVLVLFKWFVFVYVCVYVCV